MSNPTLVTIGDLEAEATLTDEALLEIEQGGASKAVSMGQIKAHVAQVIPKPVDSYTKEESDTNYPTKDASYTKSESNTLHGFLHTPMVTTTGAMSVAAGQAFKLNAGSGRTVSFTNIPSGKALTVVVKVMGDGTVTWPAGTVWVDKVPVLKATHTYVSFLLMDGNITGHMVVSV